MENILKILTFIALTGLIPITTSSKEDEYKSGESPLPTKISETENTTDYRLPENVIPKEYFIRLEPFIVPNNFTFNGEVNITANIKEATSKIILHSDRIKIHNVAVLSILENDGKLKLEIENVTEAKKYDFSIISMKSPMNTGMNISIQLSYTGVLSTDLNGLFRSWYKKNNETRWIIGTELEPSYARRVLPCFDEPALKAVFHMSVICPKNYTAISNMPIKSITKDGLVTFHATPPMSTYLLALVVSDYANLTEIKKDRSLSVSGNLDLINQLPYSLSIIPQALEIFENHFNVSYPLSKLDMVAVPDFPSTAMENWGLLIYSEMFMLYSSEKTPLSLKTYIGGLVTHEIAHQWFGNIVSPRWWSYLWLNEGFAEYFQYHAYDDIFSTWNLESQFVATDLYTAFAVDALNTTHPVTHKVYSPTDIKSIFDSISYNKAACLIRMIEKLLGQKMFFSALSRYLKSNLYSTATPELLFMAFEQELELENYKLNASITEIMNSWTLQAGFPVIKADFVGNTVTLSQKRFYLQHSENFTDHSIWFVPLSWTSGSNPDFNNTKNIVWLNTDNMTLEIPNASDDWIIFNIQQTGFYRVNYDEEMWKRIINVLKSDKRKTIHEINRASIIDDLFNLARANEVDYELALDAVMYLAEETNYIPWKVAMPGFNYLKRRSKGQPELYKSLSKFIISLLEPHYQRLGFNEKESDGYFDILHRQLILEWLCELEHENCVNESIQQFEKLRNDESFTISPNYQSFVYCVAIKYGSTEQWDYLWKKFEESNVAIERYFILTGLACSQNKAHLQRLLQATIDPEFGVRLDIVKNVMNSIAESSHLGIQTLLDFLKNNRKQIEDYMGDEDVSEEVVGYILELISTEKLIGKFTKFVKENDEGNASLQTSLQNSINNVKWFEKHSQRIFKWLEANQGH